MSAARGRESQARLIERLREFQIGSLVAGRVDVRDVCGENRLASHSKRHRIFEQAIDVKSRGLHAEFPYESTQESATAMPARISVGVDSWSLLSHLEEENRNVRSQDETLGWKNFPRESAELVAFQLVPQGAHADSEQRGGASAIAAGFDQTPLDRDSLQRFEV